MLTKSNEAHWAGSRQTSLWNIKPRKTSDPSPKRQPAWLSHSVLHFATINWTVLWPPVITYWNAVYTKQLCIISGDIGAEHLPLSLCSHLTYQEPHHFHFSLQLLSSVLFTYKELHSFLLEFAGENFCPQEELNKQETLNKWRKERRQNAKHRTLEVNNRRGVYTQTPHCHQLWQMNLHVSHSHTESNQRGSLSRGAE